MTGDKWNGRDIHETHNDKKENPDLRSLGEETVSHQRFETLKEVEVTWNN